MCYPHPWPVGKTTQLIFGFNQMDESRIFEIAHLFICIIVKC